MPLDTIIETDYKLYAIRSEWNFFTELCIWYTISRFHKSLLFLNSLTVCLDWWNRMEWSRIKRNKIMFHHLVWLKKGWNGVVSYGMHSITFHYCLYPLIWTEWQNYSIPLWRTQTMEWHVYFILLNFTLFHSTSLHSAPFFYVLKHSLRVWLNWWKWVKWSAAKWYKLMFYCLNWLK